MARARQQLVPNANNPQLLLRLIGLVAAGIRRPPTLAEILEVELRTVHYYTQAGEWLGLLSTDGEVHLTPRGVQLAFAEPGRPTQQSYADAVWRNPLVISLMTRRDRLPATPTLAVFIEEHDRSLSPSTALRRASAVRGLIAPALRLRPRSSPTQGTQLELPFVQRSTQALLPLRRAAAGRPVCRDLGDDGNPETLWRLLCALLDHGELSEGHIEALMEGMGAGGSAAGYAELAVSRGEAKRFGGHLVPTPALVEMRGGLRDPLAVALTTRGYPAHLHKVRGGGAGEPRFAAWDRVFFSGDPGAMTRALDGLPPRVPEGPELPGAHPAPFLAQIARGDLMIALPSSLAALAGGAAAVSALLTPASRPTVRLPGACDTRRLVHGGLLFPGELPSAAPTTEFELRIRALTRAPALSLIGTLLLLTRRPGSPLRVRIEGTEAEVWWEDERVGPVLPTLVAFAEHQGWRVCRPMSGGLDGRMLVALARAMGLASRAGPRLVMGESIFVRLQSHDDGRPVYTVMNRLADRMESWLSTLGAPTDPT